jgi:hypothetical protein
MSKSSLKGLLESIQGSIVGAQEMMQQQHIEELGKFINEDGTPKTQRIQVPRQGVDGSLEWLAVEVPLLVMSPPSSLRIKKLKVDFDAMLSGHAKHKDDDGEDCVHLTLGGMFSRGAKVHCEIEFEGTEPPEGWMRINDELVKVIP